MPLSSNAPFNEFGQSMILRDIEQIYLSLNGAGVGSSGDGQTQDQSVTQSQTSGDSGGIPDLSGLATIDYVDQLANQLLDSIPTVTYPISIANGGTGATNYGSAISNLGILSDVNNKTVYSSGTSTFTVPSNIYAIFFQIIGGGGGGGYASSSTAYTFYDGASTFNLNLDWMAGQGGSGGMLQGILPVTPGEQLSIVVGAGGSAGSGGTVDGSNGGYSSLGRYSVGDMLTANGGIKGGSFGTTLGQGGSVSYTSAYINRKILVLSINGRCGQRSTKLFSSSGTTSNTQPASNGHILIDGSVYGAGGIGTATGAYGWSSTAGSGGAVLLMY